MMNSEPDPINPPQAGSGPQLSAEAMRAMTLVGIDWGARRIGFAVKPAGQDWALPSEVVEVRGESEAVATVRRRIEETGAEGVIVGLPLHPDPTQSRRIRRFCRKVREPMRGVRWFFVDERFTTQTADSISISKASKRPTDDLAASLILETFIQSCR